MKQCEDVAHDRRLDWALAELEGGERPPDLAAAVVERARVGDVPLPPADSAETRPRLWVAAAAILVGLLATLGVLLRLPPGDPTAAGTETRREEPQYRRVANRTELAALPADTTAIQGSNLPADALDELARFPGLTHLALHYGGQTDPVKGQYSIRMTPNNLRSIGDEDLAKLRACRSLVSLDLTGAWNVRGDGLRHVAALPKLETLRLGYADTTDEGIAHLASLRTLKEVRVVANHALGASGIRALASLPGLEHLVISRCPQLHESALVELARAKRLAILSLADLGAFRDESGVELPSADLVRRARVEEASVAKGAGVTDHVLEELANLPRLLMLDVSRGRYGRQGVRALARANLIQLAIPGTADLDAETVAMLRSPSLVILDLSLCPALGDDLGAALRGFEKLDYLELHGLERLTDAGLAELVANVPLRRGLGVSKCRGLTAASAKLLADTTRIRQLDVRGCAGWDGALVERASQGGRKVTFFQW